MTAVFVAFAILAVAVIAKAAAELRTSSRRHTHQTHEPRTRVAVDEEIDIDGEIDLAARIDRKYAEFQAAERTRHEEELDRLVEEAREATRAEESKSR